MKGNRRYRLSVMKSISHGNIRHSIRTIVNDTAAALWWAVCMKVTLLVSITLHTEKLNHSVLHLKLQ